MVPPVFQCRAKFQQASININVRDGRQTLLRYVL